MIQMPNLNAQENLYLAYVQPIYEKAQGKRYCAFDNNPQIQAEFIDFVDKQGCGNVFSKKQLNIFAIQSSLKQKLNEKEVSLGGSQHVIKILELKRGAVGQLYLNAIAVNSSKFHDLLAKAKEEKNQEIASSESESDSDTVVTYVNVTDRSGSSSDDVNCFDTDGTWCDENEYQEAILDN